ncbi:MAG: signal peptidase II [Proteobacteria bacterium]|nr:signal peptidase II [Pseudomonadota bacterium]
MLIPKMSFTHLSKTHKKAVILSSLCLLTVICSGLALDQTTKHLSEKNLMTWSSPDNLRSYTGSLYRIVEWGNHKTARTTGPYFAFNLSYVRNPGAAWGSFSNLPDHIRIPFFNIITILCIIVILGFLIKTPYSHRTSRLAHTLIFTGALGNMSDRFRLNYVIDWIDVRWNVAGWYYAFPNFNVADICITFGATLFITDALILESLRRRKLAKQTVDTTQVSAN